MYAKPEPLALSDRILSTAACTVFNGDVVIYQWNPVPDADFYRIYKNGILEVDNMPASQEGFCPTCGGWVMTD